MEKLYYNLSEEEFSKGRKILLWVFAGLFFLAGIFVLIQSLLFGHKSIHPILSIAPFGISFVVSIIAVFATITRKDLFFLVDDEKLEFRYGMILKSLSCHINRKKLFSFLKTVLPIQLTWYGSNGKDPVISESISTMLQDKKILMWERY